MEVCVALWMRGSEGQGNCNACICQQAFHVVQIGSLIKSVPESISLGSLENYPYFLLPWMSSCIFSW